MLQSNELPLSEVIDSDQWQNIFDAHEIDFGNDEGSIYTPVIALWVLISQAFYKGEMRSCKAAVRPRYRSYLHHPRSKALPWNALNEWLSHTQWKPAATTRNPNKPATTKRNHG